MSSNEDIVRKVYKTAEEPLDIEGFIALFAEDGYLFNTSDGTRFRGKEVGELVTGFAASFPDLHREIHDMYSFGDVVVVELSLIGTNTGPIKTPGGEISATGKKMNAPCCDVFRLENGKIKSFHCYAASGMMMRQLGLFE